MTIINKIDSKSKLMCLNYRVGFSLRARKRDKIHFKLNTVK